MGKNLRTSKLNRQLFIAILAGTLTACAADSGSKPPVSASVLPYGRDLKDGPKYYVVKKGDTLYSIGFRSGYGYRKLAAWNGIRPPYTIKIGQKIQLFEASLKKTKAERAQFLLRKRLKKRNWSQKKPIFSDDKKNLLKLHWQWPIKGKIVKNFFQSGSKGIDISGQLGQSVRAAETGKVVYSGHGLLGYGNLLIIKHNEMYLSAYANNSRLLVNEGQVVKKSQVIAKVGRVGSGQPALHFEIRKNGKPVNPVSYLPKK